MKYGGVTKRPGTRLVGPVFNASEPTRLIAFQFSITQAYALEMGQGYMAPCVLGGRILEGELLISGITNATNARLSIAYSGYSVGDLIYIDGVEGGMGTVLNYRTWTVTAVIDPNTIAINADTSTCPAFVGATGGSVNTVAPPIVPPPTVPPPSSGAGTPSVAYGGGIAGSSGED
jgi:hypothetical protein